MVKAMVRPTMYTKFGPARLVVDILGLTVAFQGLVMGLPPALLGRLHMSSRYLDREQL